MGSVKPYVTAAGERRWEVFFRDETHRQHHKRGFATFEGMVDRNYRPIVSAEDVTKDKSVTLPVSDGLITGVTIRRGKPTKLRVTVKNKRKMQLAVI